MRIAAVSDIHARSNGLDAELLQKIRERVTTLNPDVFVIAGDMNHQLHELEKSLSMIHIDCCPNLYVAGNHDVWFEEELGIGTLEKYSNMINDACKSSGFIHLPNEYFITDSVAFVGSIGWYDYSFRRKELDIPLECYEMKQYRDAYWRDLYSIDWTLTDKEATEFLNKKLRYDLESLPESVENVVYVSHHLPFKELTQYRDRLPWDFFSAFMGATSTGDILRNDERVILTISGHSHIRNFLKMEGLSAITVPVGYGRPSNDNLDEFVKSAVAEIELRGANIELLHFVQGDICEGLPYSF